MMRAMRFFVLGGMVMLFTLAIVAAIAWHGVARVMIEAPDVAPQDAAVVDGALDCFAVLGLVGMLVLLAAARLVRWTG